MNKADPVFNYSKPVPDLAKRAGFNRVRVRVPGRAIFIDLEILFQKIFLEPSIYHDTKFQAPK